MFDRIVVPLDGSESAERAVLYGVELARCWGVALHLIRVAGTAEVPGTLRPGSLEALTAELSAEVAMAREYLDAICARLRDRGLTVSTEVLLGDARTQILAASRPGDIIVAASHGQGAHFGVPLGSVVEGIARYSRTPVMIVRAYR